MTKLEQDPRRVLVWVAMADHFLDTETRHDIPTTALRCVEAGLPKDEARMVWRHEVSPAVGCNVWNAAGEWAGWDQAWLVARIERRRLRWDHSLAWCRWLRDRVGLDPMRPVWVSIGRCMDALLAVHAVEERQQLCRDLGFLARHYFDFCPRDPHTLDDPELQRLRNLYPEPFQHIIGPATRSVERRVGNERVRAALEVRG
jgi:hypothetical protein